MDISGSIKMIGLEIKNPAGTFTKRELVVTTDEQYPQHILIEFVQDKCDLIDPYKVGENVKVSINLRGREWINPEGVAKYFNAIQGWRIERLASNGAMSPPAVQQQSYAMPSNSFAPATNTTEEEAEDLLF